MSNLIKHIKLVFTHKKYVGELCFKMGIPVQGILHDLSKFSLTELKISKYYTGNRSPHEEARNQLGYSPSWLNHYHKNKHHWQFWLDDCEDGSFKAIKMPYKYVIEMFCDQVGASKAYLKEKYTNKEPLKYYMTKCLGKRIMHNESQDLLLKLLNELADSKTEQEFITKYLSHKKSLERNYNGGNT